MPPRYRNRPTITTQTGRQRRAEEPSQALAPIDAPPRSENRGSSRSPIVLLPPKERYELRWEPAVGYGVTYQEESKLPELGRSRVPEFVLKNLSATVAQDVTVRWEAETRGLQELANSSSRLSEHKIEFRDGSILLGPKDFRYTHRFQYATSGIYKVAFVNDEENIYPHGAVWNGALIYFLAVLQEDVGSSAEPFIFTVSVSWGIPRNGQTQRFRVKVTATNVKPEEVKSPEVLAMMRFEVAKMASR